MIMIIYSHYKQSLLWDLRHCAGLEQIYVSVCSQYLPPILGRLLFHFYPMALRGPVFSWN